MMENKLVSGLERNEEFRENSTETLNGAYAYKSTHSALVDLFGIIGAIRDRNEDEVEELFEKAVKEDMLLAMKMSFYARNVRGGLGERKVPRTIWRWMAYNYPEVMRKNIGLVSYFGRWDDLYCFIGSPVEEDAWNLIRNQISQDINNMNQHKPISLMAKWLKSVNTSSEESNALGRLTAKKLGVSEKTYRKTLSAMRKYIDVVEVKMSENNFSSINYPAVPSRAMNIYRTAFSNKGRERFEEYKKQLVKGETKINSGTLYPYDVLDKYHLIYDYWYNKKMVCDAYDEILEQQWKALPNYVNGEHNVLVMADTSGSMFGRPIETSLGLAIYFAERNRGAFHNKFMTFSSVPHFITIKGDSLKEKVESFPVIVDNTNVEAAMEEILNVAVDNNVPAEDIPEALVIISDMEFDIASENNMIDNYWVNGGEFVRKTPQKSYQKIFEKKFAKAGYKMPTIVYWNVNSRHNVFHAYADANGVMMASGSSPSVFKAIMDNIGKTPFEAMVGVLNDSVYDCVRV